MVGKSKAWTKAHRRRAIMLKEMGCILCREQGMGWRLPDIHHLLDGGRRMGHDYTIPLDPWYHEGHPPEGMNPREAKALFGPSMKLHKREFVERFGSELDILERVDEQLKRMEAI